MRFLIVALAIVSTFGAAVPSAAVWSAVTATNASTRAAATCSGTVTVTVSAAAAQGQVVWDFLWAASATALTANDMGITMLVAIPANPFIPTAAPSCALATYTSTTAKTVVTTGVTCSTPGSATIVTSYVFTVTANLDSIAIAWNTTLNTGKNMKLFASDLTPSGMTTSTAYLPGTIISFTGGFTECKTLAESFWKSDSTSTSFLSGLLALSFF